MMNNKILLKDLKDTEKLAKIITKESFSSFNLLLDGQLGAGKTTLAQMIGKNLGVKNKIKSPTFNILKIYKGRKRNFTHLDAYRLKDSKHDIGLEEIFELQNLTLIEWPFNIEKFLPPQYLLLELEIKNENQRLITIYHKGDKYLKTLREILAKWEK